MRKLLTLAVAVVGLFGLVGKAAAEGHNADDAKALVQKAVAYLKQEGKTNALATFNDPKGAFVDGDLYLIVMDANDGKLTMLAHGVNKGLIGKPQIDVKDAEGKAFNHETAAALKADGDISVSYMWPNPATKKIARKKSYFARVGDVIIGAGVYE